MDEGFQHKMISLYQKSIYDDPKVRTYLAMAMGLSGVSTVFGPFAAALVAGLCVASGLTLFAVPALYLSVESLRTRFLARLAKMGFRPEPSAGQA